ncbi:hypothetical protein ACP275_04G184400 [Erythranthe tilingii]
MAYAAAISLKSTIERLIISPRVSIVPQSFLQTIGYLCIRQIPLLQVILRKLDEHSHAVNMKRVNALDGQIRDALHEFEDVLDSHASAQFLSQEEDDQNQHPLIFSLDLHELEYVTGPFMYMLNHMMEEYLHELKNPSPEEENDDRVWPSRIDFGEPADGPSEMVGLSDLFGIIKTQIKKECSVHVPERMISTLKGMAGIGKTALAKKLLKDPFILSDFKKRVFVTIGPQYKLERILSDILRQVKTTRDVDDDKMLRLMGEEEKIAALKGMIIKGLEDCRYFVVLDDLWHMKLWYRELAELFIWRGDGSHVMLTTRIQNVASIADWGCDYHMRFMDKKESWDLLRMKVFGEQESLPYELEKAGKKIAEICEGLPLTIVTVADILSKAEKTTEYWTNIADDKRHSVFLDAYDKMSKVLYPSYDYLPQHLKPCFLYMGIFPQNNENPLVQLTDLWLAEEFIVSGSSTYKSLEHIASGSLVMSTCTLHPAFWHMCNKEASKSKFYHALNTCVDVLTDRIKLQRRLCIQNNVLFGIKVVYDSLTSISKVRSLLCTGPYHQYPVPLLCLENFRLLKILHALTIRFYEFPIDLLMKLVRLTYLAFTYDENLPASISKLWNLEVLIINRHLSIVESSKNSSYMPMEIWDMKELKDIRITGSNLPHPREGSVLQSLRTLLGVGPQSCTKDVFERIPNLLNLGIQIELAPDATREPFRFFDHISHLHKLKTLQCVIVNPIPKTDIPTHLPIFPSNLVDLTLSGLGYPWEETSMISSLPNLTKLKLQCYAFRGPKWRVHKNEFRQLEMLMIEDTDLVNWTVEDYQCLDKLEWLGIQHCYKLDEIPHAFGEELQTIKIVDCNPLALAGAKQLKKDLDGKYNCRRRPLELTIDSTWDI